MDRVGSESSRTLKALNGKRAAIAAHIGNQQPVKTGAADAIRVPDRRRDMSHYHSQQPARRLAVILYGVHKRNRQYERALKKNAAAEALRLLDRAEADCVVWSHSFPFEGEDFLLSTMMQPPREVARRVNGHCAETAELGGRLVIEVEPAPPALTKRTLFRPRELPSRAAPQGKRANSTRRASRS
jgi:hypothetical protein